MSDSKWFNYIAVTAFLQFCTTQFKVYGRELQARGVVLKLIQLLRGLLERIHLQEKAMLAAVSRKVHVLIFPYVTCAMSKFIKTGVYINVQLYSGVHSLYIA
jgi:hypothetical protein